MSQLSFYLIFAWIGNSFRDRLPFRLIDPGREHEGRDRAAQLLDNASGEFPALGDQSSARHRTRSRRVTDCGSDRGLARGERFQSRERDPRAFLHFIHSQFLSVAMRCTIFLQLTSVARIQRAVSWFWENQRIRVRWSVSALKKITCERKGANVVLGWIIFLFLLYIFYTYEFTNSAAKQIHDSLVMGHSFSIVNLYC